MSCTRFQDCRGSVLVTAVVASGILAIVVVGVLTYMGNEYYLNMRSHRWNQALHLAEAGVEIGFAELTYHKSDLFSSANGWSTPFGWSPSYHTRTITNLTDLAGGVVGTIEVRVLDINTNCPSITAIGTCTTLPRGPTVSRAVKAILVNSSLYPAALVGRSKITLSGGSSIDSFDSSDPAKSTGGHYDPTKRQANGDVGTNAGIDRADVFSGGITVYGTAATGPGGTVNMSGGASVGPTFVAGDRATTVSEGEGKGFIRHDFAVSIPDVTLPADLSSATSLGDIGNSTGTINGGDYQANQIKLSSSATLAINGDVRLYVQNDVALSGSSSIVLSSGSTLQIYIGGKVTVSGQGVINGTTLAAKNSWYGLPTSTTWSFSGGSEWIGTIYAPSADVTMSGNSAASGAMVGKTLTYTGTSGFHYDEALRGASTGGGFVLGSWQELRFVSGIWQ
jgi:hypothetical protein